MLIYEFVDVLSSSLEVPLHTVNTVGIHELDVSLGTKRKNPFSVELQRQWHNIKIGDNGNSL